MHGSGGIDNVEHVLFILIVDIRVQQKQHQMVFSCCAHVRSHGRMRADEDQYTIKCLFSHMLLHS